MEVGRARRHVTSKMRGIYSSLGFTRFYTFAFWFSLSGVMVGFVLARVRYLDIDNVFCRPRAALPGECFHLGTGRGKVGILLHLAAIFPASLLAVVQFVPVIRRKALLFHRINGYVVMLLCLVSTIGVMMIIKQHFGGGINSQVVTAVATIMFLGSLGLAYYNIKRLQIDQHRAWMLRAWFIASHPISMRLISKLLVPFTSVPFNNYYDHRSCEVIDFMFRSNASLVQSLYPDCVNFYTGSNVAQHVLIRADLTAGRPDQIAAGLNVTFGPASWLALILHCIAVEVYLHRTPKEAKRLRELSSARQAEVGARCTSSNEADTSSHTREPKIWTCDAIKSASEGNLSVVTQ